MKSSTILKHKFFYPSLAVAAGILFIAAMAWFGASDDVHVPKADEYRQRSANSHIESVISESNANMTRQQIEAVEAERQSAKQELQASKDVARKAGSNLSIRKVEYEKIRKGVSVINSTDLDKRESVLLTDLRKLYWEQG